ncbi:hypothetical protein SAMD00019534_100460 [Acytostelium subglobosum LB1]|uniref:hypothetical protein n=1 Tax=Acytostelium subglobosum LB1 TaxID=1410327 RepID=UPI000644B91B|nr:hypothetical protein SAMD00019534_100460 [Acytostelium subglobosum LB1]GAM26871.1 hypothetical protein SAMD00019534_100460 [Acytostelium subglobosum LB1]|eukprot:XP_012750139.1 hypothetical protein SAMD00019534_100460 [Acytostelium subglobosum LB1]
MFIKVTKMLSNILFHGNADILKQYLEINPYRHLPNNKVSKLPYAVDSGNEQCLRLFLQHLTIDDDAKDRVDYIAFKRPGVSVGILKILHEEFNCLFAFKELWMPVLRHSIHHNMVDSVKYILDRAPDNQDLNVLISSHLIQFAKDNNVAMFEIFNKSTFGAKFIKMDDFGRLIKEAASKGHESFIQHLLKHHVGNGNITISSEDMLSEVMDLTLGKLRVTGVIALLNNDVMNAESLLDEIEQLDKEHCLEMSEAMALMLCSPRTPPKTFYENTLPNLIDAIGKPGSNITEDIVCQFIVNCKHSMHNNYPTYAHSNPINNAMKFAACFSARVMRLLHDQLGAEYEHSYLKEAIDSNCRDTLALLFEHIDKTDLDLGPFDQEVFQYITQASLDDVIFILTHMDQIRKNPVICEQAIYNDDPSVFEYVVGLFTNEQLEGKVLHRTINQSLTKDRLDIVLLLEDRFKRQFLRPTLDTFESMALSNAYRSLEYHFNSSTFTNMPITHRLRTVHSIKDKAYDEGSTRVVKLCDDQIKSLTIQQQQSQLPVQLSIEVPLALFSSQLETAVHAVFGDRKLGMHIMEQVGLVHKSLGAKSDQVIKGAGLIGSHSLSDYIKYGATEWFLKAYSSSTSSLDRDTIQNTVLLGIAFNKCNSHVIDVLLDNPIMTLLEDDDLTHSFFWNVSSCTHPDWERMTEQYLMIKFQSAPLDLDSEIISMIQHPSFLRKLIQSGAKPLARPSEPEEYIDNVTKGWLTKPWALEMLELLIQHELLSSDMMEQLSLKAIELNIMSVVTYLIDLYQAPQMEESRTRFITNVIVGCCRHGRVEQLDLMLPFIEANIDQHYQDWITVSFQSGHVSVVQRIHAVIMSNVQNDSFNILDYLDVPLANGHIDLVNFILDQTTPTGISGFIATPWHERSNVKEVHHSILSTELVGRLLLYRLPLLGSLLGCAIKAGNRNVINMLKHDVKCARINFNYRYALGQALHAGDVDSIQWIIQQQSGIILYEYDPLEFDKLFGSLIELIVEPTNINVTEEVIVMLIKTLDRDMISRNMSKILKIAASKSVAAIKMVIKRFTTFDKGDRISAVHQLLTSEIREVINVSMKRGDFDSIEYLLHLALTVASVAIYRENRHQLQDLINLEHLNGPILAQLLDKGLVGVDGKSDLLARMVDWAFSEGKLDIIQLVHQRCNTPEQLKRHLPSIFNILDTALKNHHNVLSYMFEGHASGSGNQSTIITPFKRAMVETDIVSLLKVVRLCNCSKDVNLNTVAMCDRLIKDHDGTTFK